MFSQCKYQYLPYEAQDETYFGCRRVLEAEWDYLLKRRDYQKGVIHKTHAGADQQQHASDEKKAERPVGFWASLAAILFGKNIEPVCASLASFPEDSKKDDQEKTAPKDLSGIALSGGGIRSASFCLGVLQALAYAGWLKRLDYLSSVSGGGYIGGSLTWLLHKKWQGAKGEDLPFGLERRDFPYGSYPMAGMEDVDAAGKNEAWNVYKGRMLRYLRQHARYLTPGDGINIMSLAAVVLRNTVFSLFVYGSVLVVLFALAWPYVFAPADNLMPFQWLMENVPWFPRGINGALAAAIVLALLLLVAIVVYAVRAWLPRRTSSGYRLRYVYECSMGRLLTLLLVVAVIGSIPAISGWIDQAGRGKPDVAKISLSVKSEKLGEVHLKGEIKPNAKPVAIVAPAGRETANAATINAAAKPQESQAPPKWRFKNFQAALAGAFSTLFGAMAAFLAFVQEGKPKKKIPTSVYVALASFGLIFGLLLLAYHFAHWLHTDALALIARGPAAFFTQETLLKHAWLLLFAALFLFFLRGPNLNYLSIHRYYRDRLMETFTPDLPDAIHVNGPIPGLEKSADHTELYKMVDEAKLGEWGPYPIINANIVLVTSAIPKFRGRGGDNFILTPKFCGSNATGWCETRGSPYDNMTLPTAMAISGAAVHSNVSGGGTGLTRTPWLSFLMGFFNIRLGYWADNPTPKWERLCRIAEAKLRQLELPERCDYPVQHLGRSLWDGVLGIWRRLRNAVAMAFQWLLSLPIFAATSKPNALYPGIFEMFMRKNLNENSRMVQLSDGGHFENLGLYELIRRKLKLIIVCDGSADPKYGFEDLANAIEKVRADFGALVLFDSADMETLTPKSVIETGEDAGKKVSYAERGYLIGRVIYKDRDEATLIYLTTSFFKDVSADLYAYRKAHHEFPDEPTSDQFFGEQQFEAYRELGYQLAYRLMHDRKVLRNADVQRILGDPDVGKNAK